MLGGDCNSSAEIDIAKTKDGSIYRTESVCVSAVLSIKKTELVKFCFKKKPTTGKASIAQCINLKLSGSLLGEFTA